MPRLGSDPGAQCEGRRQGLRREGTTRRPTTSSTVLSYTSRKAATKAQALLASVAHNGERTREEQTVSYKQNTLSQTRSLKGPGRPHKPQGP
jgi:hypothetical protein